MLLTLVEARVLGSLIEKEITTPEYYPLSLNALLNASNQKSSRDPVMELDERTVRSALSSLEELGLVRVLADARVPKFEHRVRDGLGRGGGDLNNALRRDEVAVLCLLLLRGPQTTAELRTRSERLYPFDDNAAVQSTLDRMAARSEPLTQTLPRQPGAREVRWQQLLTGGAPEAEPPAERVAYTSPASSSREDHLSLQQQMAALEEKVRRLEERLDRLGA